jgi:hypothetical protein
MTTLSLRIWDLGFGIFQSSIHNPKSKMGIVA